MNLSCCISSHLTEIQNARPRWRYTSSGALYSFCLCVSSDEKPVMNGMSELEVRFSLITDRNNLSV